MAFLETYKLAQELLSKIDEYAKDKTLSDVYYGAKNTISDLLNISFTDIDTEFKFNKWLKSKSTLDLKEIVPSDNLYDFNVMSYLDTVQCK